MRRRQTLQRFTHQGFLGGVLHVVQHAAHSLKTVEQQIRVDDVGFAIASDLLDLAVAVSLPHLAAVHAELAGVAGKPGQNVQRRIRTRLVQRKYVHQVNVTRVITADVIVVAKLGIVHAELPVARRRNTRQQAAIVQHWKVETAAIPTDDLRRVPIDHSKEALD